MGRADKLPPIQVVFDEKNLGLQSFSNGKVTYPRRGGLVAPHPAYPDAFHFQADTPSALAATVLFAARRLSEQLASGPSKAVITVADSSAEPIVLHAEEMLNERPEGLTSAELELIQTAFPLDAIFEAGQGRWDSSSLYVLGLGATAWRALERAR